MAKPVSKTLIGAFVLGAVALVFGAVVVLGSGKLFRDTREVVMFFDGSVAGLNVGAPVTFRGVTIGQVTTIAIVYESGQKEFRVPVTAELYPDRIVRLGPTRGTKLAQLIEDGLRAQLQLQSLITGQLSIQLSFMPDTPPGFTGPEKAGRGARVDEIPTVPTPLQRIEQSFQQIPLDEVVRDARDTLASIRDILTSPAIPEIIANLQEVSRNAAGLTRSIDGRLLTTTMQLDLALKDIRALVDKANRQITPLAGAIEEIRSLAGNLNRQVEPVAAEIRRTMAELNATLQQSQQTFANLSTMTGQDAEFRYNLEVLMTELSAAARSLRAFSDYLDRNPGSLLRGKTGIFPVGGQP
jgi:paraquat-inducible protein B